MAKRIVMRVELNPKSKDRLGEFCDRTGMTQIAAVSRLIDWFCRQSETIQAIIQGLFPASLEPDVAAMILERTANEKRDSAA